MNNQTITEVSRVTTITGVAKIKLPDGELKEIHVGDILQPGTVVILDNATVFLFETTMPDGSSAIAELPADQQPAMPAMGAAAEGGDQTLAQINQLQQAILAGQDPTQAFEAAAAGIPADAGGTGAGSGNSGFISVDRIGNSTIATAGYDTTAFLGETTPIPEPTAAAITTNSPTLVTPDVNTVSEDNPATGNVLVNDSDDDDVLTVGSFVVGGVTYTAGNTATLEGVGTIVINPDGSYIFTPVANWNGAVPEVTYTTNTGSSSTLNVDVTAVNDAPVLVDENQAPLGTDMNVTTPEDTPVDGTLLATDADNDTLTFSKGTDPTNGTVVVNTDGSWTYTPNTNYNGSDSFTAVVSDGQGGTDTIVVNIGVTPVNDPPVIVDENEAPLGTDMSVTTPEDTPVDGTLLATDADNDTLTFSKGTDPTNGTVVVNTDGSWTYTPNTNYNGSDSFTAVVSDGQGGTDTIVVNIGVTPVNDPPVIVDENEAPLGTDMSVTTPEDTPVDGTLLATDADNDTLTFSKGTDPTNGTVVVNTDGSWTYTPNTNYNGSDSFTAVVSDGQGGTDTIVVNIGVTPVNDPPVIVDENQAPLGTDMSVTTPEDTPVDGTLLATDADNDTLTFSKGTDPTNGTVVVNTDGSWTYTPNTNYNGSDSFTAVVSDGQGGTDTIIVNIGVTPVNDNPVAVANSYTVNEGSTVSGNLITDDANGSTPGGVDYDLDGETLTITAINGVSVTFVGDVATVPVTNGSLEIRPDGSFTYTHDGSQPTQTSFTYTITDGNGASSTSTANVVMDVNDVNDQPVAGNDSNSVQEDAIVTTTALVGSVLLNDTDADGDTLSVTAIRTGSEGGSGTAGIVGSALVGTYGTLTVYADGHYSYTADQAAADALAKDATATDTFTYTMSDGLASDTAQLVITITGTNDGPVAVNDVNAVAEDATVTTTALTGVLSNDTDVDHGTLSVTAIRTGSEGGSGTAGIVGSALVGTYGTLTVYADGHYSYTADQAAADALAKDATATDTFTYTMSDGLASDTAQLVITITGTNDGPVAVNDVNAVAEDATVTTTALTGVLSNDTDVDHGTLSVTAIRTGSEGGSGTAGIVGSALVGTYGTLTVYADGHYSYTADQAAADALAKDATATDTFTYTMSDGLASDTAQLVITITGTNDGPVAVNDVNAVAEDATVTTTALTGVLSNDTDVDHGTLSVTAIRTGSEGGSGTAGIVGSALVGTYGTLTVYADGHYSYTADQAAADALAKDATATDTFTYTMSDGLASDTAQLVITITGTNDGPVAVNDVNAVAEDATVTTTALTGVLSNDTDVDHGTLSVTAIRTGSEGGSGTAGIVGSALVGTYGTLTVYADGHYSYTADQAAADALAKDATATDTFTYTMSDGLASDTAQLVITITGTNDGPVAVNDVNAVAEDATVTTTALTGVLSNDTDVDHGTLSVTAIRTGSEGGSGTAGIVGSALVGTYGTLTVYADGHYSYTADQAAADALAKDATATDTFTYTMSDGLASDTAQLVITITGTNDGPVAVNDVNAVAEDATVTTTALTGVLSNDTDVDHGTLSVTAIRTGSEGGSGTAGIVGSALVGTYGTLTVYADGHYSYTADQAAADALAKDATATDTFTYTMSDGLASDTAQLVITITGTNDGPVAVNDVNAVAEDATVTTTALTGVLSNDTDVDHGTLSVTAIRTGSEGGSGTAGIVGSALVGTYGTLTVYADGHYSYTADQAAADALAKDATATDTFTYTMSDGLASDTAQLVITITGTNDGPVAVNDVNAVAEDATVTTTALTGVLSNDTDVDHGTLSVTAIRTGSEGGSGTAGIVGSALVGTYGTLTVYADGHYSYTADQAAADALAKDATATDTFTYTMSDGLASDTAQLVITITGTNDGPVAVNDVNAVAEDATVTTTALTGVLSNDTDVDHGTLSVTAIRTGSEGGSGTAGIVGSALVGTYGTLTVYADGHYSYTADQAAADALAKDATATDTFTYTMSDGLASDTAQLVITITGTNDGPVAVNDVNAVAEDATVTTTALTGVLSNDTDVDHGTLSVTAIRTGSEGGSGTAGIVGSALVGTYGTLTVYADGHYSYTADQAAADALAKDATATDTFTYTMSDGLASDTAQLVITITGTNDGPVAVNDVNAVAEDATVTTTALTGVLSNDTDVDHGTLSVTAIRTGSEGGSGTAGTVGSALVGTYGTLTVYADGHYSYTADQAAADALAKDATATDTFTYTMSDGLASDTAQLVITITGTNDGPVAVNDVNAVAEDATVTTTALTGVLSNDTDVDHGTLSVTAIRTGSEGGSGTAGIVGSALVGTYGTLTVYADGHYSYTADQAAADALAKDATATDTFTYTMSDGLASDTAQLVITITGTNDGPVAVNDVNAVAEDATVTTTALTGVLSNDTDVDHGTLSVTAIRTGSEGGSGTAGIVGSALVGTYGTLTVYADGHYSYTADQAAADALAKDATATDTFTYTMSDGLASDTAQLVITITGTNDGPVAVNDVNAVAEDATVTTTALTGVLSNDTDVDHGTLSVTAIRTGSEGGSGTAGIVGSALVGTYGTLTVYADGHYSYTADQAAADALAKDATATDTFTYTMSDGLASDTAQLVITITGTNDGPVAVNDVNAVAEDATVTTTALTGVLSNDTDVDHGTLSVTAIRTGSEGGSGTAGIVGSALVGTYGTLTVYADGHYSYTADQAAADALAKDATATDTFTYTMSDGLASDTAQLVITITGTNDDPSIIIDTGNPQNANDQVYESGLAAGTHVAPTTTAETGTFTLSDADGLGDIQSVTINGTTIGITSLAGSHIDGSYGTLTITGYNASTGIATYSYQLTSAATDVDGSFESDDFILQVSDGVTTSVPATIAVEINDDVPVATPAYNSGQSVLQTNTNLMLILDVSGSMGNASGYQGMTRLQVMQKSALELLERYDALGNVRVNIITFSTLAANPTNNWVTIDVAKAIILGLVANGNTNYDDALNEAWRAFASDTGALTGGQNISYFMSDGAPNTSTLSNSTLATYGTSTNDLGGGSGIDADEEADWVGFLKNFDIKSYALGMGSGVNQVNLNPIAYNGISETNMDSIVVTDLSQLQQTLVSTVVTPPLAGDILDGGVLPGNAGADGGWVQSVTVNGITYSYDQVLDTYAVSGGVSAGTFNTTTHEWTISTPAGSSLKIDMDDGQYVYTALGTSISVISETFGYTIIDGDGDTASSSLIVTVDPATDPLVVRDDRIITNQATSTIPEWALLANDTGTGVHDITAISGVAASDAAVLATGYVTYTDNSPTGGSFTYTDTVNSLSDSANASVVRDNSGAIGGSYLDEILIGGVDDDTLNGNAGNDILIGNAGNDTLNGGDGDDLLAGGSGNDALNGGNGSDTAVYIDASAGVTVTLASSSAQNTGGDGTDTLNSIENLIGSAYGDTLTGDGNANHISGGAGVDTISGGGGNDTITGGQGDDILTGGSGIDVFTWTDSDLVGGHYSDTIKDFSINATSGDKLDLSDVLDTGDSYAITQDPNNAANAMLTVTKSGSATPDMTIILENHGGDALDDLQTYLSHDENLIK